MLEALIAELASIEDPRCEWKVEHRLLDILVIAVCAVLGEAESFEDIALYGRCKHEWLARFLALPNGIPSHDTFRRVLMLVDPDAFERSFLGWVRAAFRPDADAPRQVAIDGKTVRRSFDRKRDRSPLHLVSAYATEGGLVLAQRAAETKGGELAVPPDLAGRPRPRGLPGEPGRARLPARDRRAGRGPGRRLPARPQGQSQGGPRRGGGLVRGQRLRARRAAAAVLRRVRRRPWPLGTAAGVCLPPPPPLHPPPRVARAGHPGGGRGPPPP